MLRTIGYLNSAMQGSHFYAVELVRFLGDGVSAFESRVTSKPQRDATSRAISLTSEAAFLESVQSEDYRHALQEFFEACRGLRLQFEWGSVGTSIRLATAERPEPVTVAWVFPPGKSGWMGLRDLNLGFDPGTARHTPQTAPLLEKYAQEVESLPGAEEVSAAGLRAYKISPDATILLKDRLVETLASLVERVQEIG